MATLIAILVASLFGSLHCAGMCGPLVAFAVGGADIQSNSVRVLLHAMYHGGRLVSYALIGAVCGLLGAALDLGGAMAGLHRIASLLAGGMMIAVGIIAVLHYKGVCRSYPLRSFRKPSSLASVRPLDCDRFREP